MAKSIGKMSSEEKATLNIRIEAEESFEVVDFGGDDGHENDMADYLASLLG